MKRLFLSVICSIVSFICISAQNIKYLELSQNELFTPSPVSDEWRQVDSIVVSGILGNKNYNQLRVLAEYFNLTGLDLTNCKIQNDSIDYMAFKPYNVCLIPGQGDAEYNYGYKSIKTEERYFRVNLKHISFPKNLSKIGEGAFYWNNLESLELPKCVKTIDNKAFSGCKYLKSVILHVSSPLDIILGKDVFEDIAKDAVLYVPEGARENFVYDEYWGNVFKEIHEYSDVSSISETFISLPSTNNSIYYFDGKYAGTDFSKLLHGVYIVNGKKVLK